MSSIAVSEPISRAMQTTPNAERTSRLSLIAGLSGIIFVVLLVGPLFAFGLAPSPTTGPGDVAQYYAEHTGALQTIQVLRASSSLFFLVFLASDLIPPRSGSGALRPPPPVAAPLRCALFPAATPRVRTTAKQTSVFAEPLFAAMSAARRGPRFEIPLFDVASQCSKPKGLHHGRLCHAAARPHHADLSLDRSHLSAGLRPQASVRWPGLPVSQSAARLSNPLVGCFRPDRRSLRRRCPSLARSHRRSTSLLRQG